MLLHIDDLPVSFSALWVHLKNTPAPVSAYRIEVPSEHLQTVFDPYGEKPSAEIWSTYIRRDLSILGTAGVEAYIKSIRQITGEPDQKSNWVLTSVDQIQDSESSVILIGSVESFLGGEIVTHELK